jgi:hypothetical protein
MQCVGYQVCHNEHDEWNSTLLTHAHTRLAQNIIGHTNDETAVADLHYHIGVLAIALDATQVHLGHDAVE